MTMSIAPRFHRARRIRRRVAGDQMVSLVTIAVRASGNSAATSSAMRSTPGPQATRLSSLAAFGAGRGRRHDMAAMVAGQAVHQPVLDHPGGAIGALEAVAAGAAQGQRRKAAAVEEQQALLAALRDWPRARRPASAPASGRAAADPGSCRWRGSRAAARRRSGSAARPRDSGPSSTMWRVSIAGVAEDRTTGISSNMPRITAMSRA